MPRRERATQPAPAGIRFTGDFDFVETATTVAYRKGHVVVNPSARLRDAALASGKAVEDGEG